MGNNTGVSVAGAWGQFELNVFKPMLIASLLQSVRCALAAIVITVFCQPASQPASAKLSQTTLYHAGQHVILVAPASVPSEKTRRRFQELFIFAIYWPAG